MPLVLLCGQPSSGKSTRAGELVRHLRAQGRRVHWVGIGGDGDVESTVHFERNVVYSDPNEEKKARGAIMAAIERLLSSEVVVVVDWLNYIKGFRYQAYCVAKTCSTPIECGGPIEMVRTWNASRPDGERYESSIFEGLWTRYEAPNPMNRWDKPLLVVPWTDALPTAAIEAALSAGNVAPHVATKVVPVSETNYLYELDRVTQDIAQAITAAQKLQTGSAIRVPHTTAEVVLGRPVTVPELHRIRRQFLSTNKVNVIQDIGMIGSTFVDFLHVALAD